MEKEKEIEIEDYKRGLENGIQYALSECGNCAPPTGTGQPCTPSYQEGFDRGVESARRVLRQSLEINMEIGGQDSDDEGDAAPKTAFLEDAEGIPAEYVNPIEANTLENSLLSEPHKLRFLHYLRNGYAVYLRWLKDKAHIGGLSRQWDDYLTFALARDLNCYGSRQSVTQCMGDDIDFIAFVHSFPDDEKDGESILRKYNETSSLLGRPSQEEIQCALSNIPTMTTEEFYVRLKKVPESMLDGHSRKIWRGTDGLVCSENVTISLSDLETGKPFAPPCGFHLGLKMLETNGFMDFPEKREYKNTRKILFKD